MKQACVAPEDIVTELENVISAIDKSSNLEFCYLRGFLCDFYIVFCVIFLGFGLKSLKMGIVLRIF